MTSVTAAQGRAAVCNGSPRLLRSLFTHSSFRSAARLRKAACRSARQDLTAPGLQKTGVRAFKEDAKIQDWRVKQMVELAHAYLVDFLSHKREELAPQLFDEAVVHKDVVWDPSHPTAGVEGMRHYLHDLSTAFPDVWIEVDQYAVVDTGSIMVTYHGSATNLGEYHHHKPTRHTSAFKGVNVFKFNADRTRITEISVYRSAFAEDINEMGERVLAQEGGFRELRLKRLV